MTPGQLLSLVKSLVILALAVGAAWFWRHYERLVTDNQQLTAAVEAHDEAIRALTRRTSATDAAVAALTADAKHVRAQTASALSRLDKVRRDDPDTHKVDVPWPAAVRFRVFDDPDPTTGSTARASVAPTGAGGVAVPEPRRLDGGPGDDAVGHRQAADPD